MNLLLDMDVAIWFAEGNTRPPEAARNQIRQASAVFVSSASLWEIAIKVSSGKLDIELGTFVANLRANDFAGLPVTWEHAMAVRALPPIHRDPFDRILVAQAICEPLRLLTGDAALAGYSDLVTVV
ncbi:type II toxin-antitoxin system VapC family toxin [Prosthecomicrobium sp. N25]|uniref:type II toxin-antitoxin system VapC family toxin n=1 Tax=Prosthecomicrobium sp. N25 TaxID=3129254 RepID=UPI003077AEBB